MMIDCYREGTSKSCSRRAFPTPRASDQHEVLRIVCGGKEDKYSYRSQLLVPRLPRAGLVIYEGVKGSLSYVPPKPAYGVRISPSAPAVRPQCGARITEANAY